MSEVKTFQERRTLAFFLSMLIIGIFMIFSLQRDPDTGGITINPMLVIWGILIAVLIYVALTFSGYREQFPIRMRFCVACGRNIPFDAIICPYCRHDYEKNNEK